MRDIKFRVWVEQFKEMYVVREINFDEESTSVTLKGKYTDDGYPDDNLIFINKKARILDPTFGVLMQYTGLKDKNGKEIHEGDIVKPFLRDDKLEVVKIHHAIYCEPFHYYDSPEDFEVIGNIYENPELLSPNPQPLPAP
jgi:uncharacterized phage protein (TIGR01671 family)